MDAHIRKILAEFTEECKRERALLLLNHQCEINEFDLESSHLKESLESIILLKEFFVDSFGNTKLHILAQESEKTTESKIKDLLQTSPEMPINATNMHGNTPLMTAVIHANTSAVRILVEEYRARSLYLYTKNIHGADIIDIANHLVRTGNNQGHAILKLLTK
jgi:ankyrin repeat protein